jgi:translocator protein
LYSINWNGFGITPQGWAVIMMVVASLIGVMMALSRKDSGYLFVFVWAFAGIAAKQAVEPQVAITAWVATVTMFGFAIYSIFQRRRHSSDSNYTFRSG